MKLIQTREATRNAGQSPDLQHLTNPLKKRLNSDIAERKNMKRSDTPQGTSTTKVVLDAEDASSFLKQRQKQQNNPQTQANYQPLPTKLQKQALSSDSFSTQTAQTQLNKLRIVKSTHHQSQTDALKVGTDPTVIEEISDIGVLDNEGLSPKITSPTGEYFTQQEKRSFVPDKSKLILEGKQKPQITRNRRTQQLRQEFAKETGCQTSPVMFAQKSKSSQTERSQEDCDVDMASTQQHSRDAFQDVKSGCSTTRNNNNPLSQQHQHDNTQKWFQIAPQAQVLNLPNKIFARGSGSMICTAKRHQLQAKDEQQAVFSQRQQREFKMSLLKTNQAQANDKFFLNDAQNEAQTNAGLSTSQNLQHHAKTSHNNRATPKPIQMMHTAVRMSQKKRRTRQRLASQRETDKMQDVFSWNKLSHFSPRSDDQGSSNLHESVIRKVSVRNSKINTRSQTSLMHVTGAFKDHSTKAVSSEREISRSFIRNQLNKTQQFFMHASRTPTGAEYDHQLQQQQQQELQIEQNKRQIEDVIGKERVDMMRIKVKQSLQAIDDSMMASIRSTKNRTDVRSVDSDLANSEHASKSSLKVVVKTRAEGRAHEHQHESIVSFVDKKYGTDMLLNCNFDGSVQQAVVDVHDSLMRDKQGQEVAASGALDSFRIAASRTQCSKATSPQNMEQFASHLSAQLNFDSSDSKKLKQLPQRQKVEMIETRLINQMKRDLDIRELKVYSQHGLSTHTTFNQNEAEIYNLREHPEWTTVTLKLQSLYLQTLDDFNVQLVAKNYFNRSEISTKQSQKSQMTNQKSDFVEKLMSRLKNLFQQQNKLQVESVRQLTVLKEENTRLQSKIDSFRREEIRIADTKAVLKELIDQYFQVGLDKVIKSKRIQEADDFLKSQPLSEIMDIEKYEKISRLDYSNTLSRLEQVVIAMQMPSILNSGVKFDMSDHQFDPDFSQKIKSQFANPIQRAQYSSAFAALTMVHKDIKLDEVGVQAHDYEIDYDLFQEIRFLKDNIVRLQSEMNTMKAKMQGNDRAMKNAAREKQDAMMTSKAYEQSFKDSKQEQIKAQNLISQYKLLYKKAQTENDEFIKQVSRYSNQIDKHKRNEKMAENIIDKLYQASSRKDVLIRELAALLEILECYADAEQTLRIKKMRDMRKKIDEKQQELTKDMQEFQRRDLGTRIQANDKKGRDQGKKGARDNDRPDSKELLERDKKKPDSRQTQSRSSMRSQVKRQTSKNQKGQGKAALGRTQSKDSASQDEKSEAAFKRQGGRKASRQSKSSKITDEVVSEKEEEESPPKKRAKKKGKVAKQPDAQVSRLTDSGGEGSLHGINESEELDNEHAMTIQQNSLSLSKSQDSVGEAKLVQSPDSKRKRSQEPLKIKTDKFKVDTKLGMPVSQINPSDRTDAIISDRFAESTEEQPEQPTKIKGINKRDIVVSSGAQQEKKKVRVTSSSAQSDTEQFFIYIFSFLNELERRMNSGDLSIEDILAMGRMAIKEKLAEENAAAGGSRAWTYESPDKSTKQQMYFSIQELRDCLARLRSLSAHGGDIFFAGIARTMVARPIIPRSYDQQQSYQRYVEEENEDELNARQEAAMAKLHSMIKVRNSAGGGSILQRTPQKSPTKTTTTVFP